jgi:PAS domain S-box-containing protein
VDDNSGIQGNTQTSAEGGQTPFEAGSAHLLELLFAQSRDGLFFMMLDEPITWDDTVDKEAVLDYVFEHQRITRVNDVMLTQYRATPDRFLGVTPAALFAHDIPSGRRAWRDLFDRGQLHARTRERRMDGTAIDIEGDYICLYDDARRITGHFGIQRVVSESRPDADPGSLRHSSAAQPDVRLEHGARSPEAPEGRIRALVNALPDLVFVIDGDGRYVEIVTDDDKRLYRSAAELLGKRLHDVLPDSAATPLLEVVRRTLHSGAPQVLEYPLQDAQGRQWFEARTAPVPNGDAARSPSAVVIVRDITDRKRADELEHQNLYLREAFDEDLHFGEIHGRSAAMQAVFRLVALVADTDSSVLLLGETGTGKELVARAIHRASRRKAQAMVKVNCGALPATLVESELFGHERGAFTGAVQQKRGRFELAHRGTVLLDEVGDLPLDAQVKLLRVLQEQEFERVGGTETLRVDTRVIAATNRDLADATRHGTFRPDLYFRLNIFPINLPPLRDRREDIPVLAHHFVREFSRRMNRSIEQIDGRALDELGAYAWPGNVRELANVLERAVILCQERVLRPQHLGLPSSSGPTGDTEGRLGTLEEIERQHIRRALEQAGGMLGGPYGAAAILGLNRSTLWSRLKRLGIDVPRQ